MAKFIFSTLVVLFLTGVMQLNGKSSDVNKDGNKAVLEVGPPYYAPIQ